MLLHIQIDNGEWYLINQHGHITQYSRKEFTGKWKMLGISYHHWTRRIETSFNEIWKNPSLALRGRVWDLDHGTTKQWAGRKIISVYKQ